MGEIHDVIVVGGGPAGATAAMFGARVGRRVLLLRGNVAESLIAGAPVIDNYPGLPRANGRDLLNVLHRQCGEAGVVMTDHHGVAFELENRRKIILDDSGRRHEGKTLILAVGTRPYRPAIPGLDRYWGQGVSVCAWCDGALYQNRRVGVFGGGNTAFSSAAILGRIAREVFLLLPKRSGTAFSGVSDQLRHLSNISLMESVEIREIQGNTNVQGLELHVDGQRKTLPLDGLFLALGQIPNTEFLGDSISRTRSGFVLADTMGQTNIPGVFAAGDVVAGMFRQLVVACGSGATAALSAESHLSRQWMT